MKRRCLQLLVGLALFPFLASAQFVGGNGNGVKLSLQVQNGNAIVSWPSGITTNQVQLQTAASLAGPWQNVGSPTTASSMTTPMSGPLGFYRLLVLTNANTDSTGGQLQWLKTMQGPASSGSVISYGVATDGSGNAISAGTFSGTVDLGQGSVSSVAGGLDCFLSKYNASGSLAWVKTMGGSGDDSVYGVATDSQNNIIVTGGFHGVVDFGGATLTSQGYYDIFVVKYSSTGSLLWAKRFGGPWDDIGAAVAVDGNDNIFLAARFQSQPADFGGISLSAAGTSGGFDVALVKLSSAGTVTWAKRWGGSDNDLPTGIAVDRSGDIVVSGEFWGTTDVGGGARTSAGNSDMFVAKYSGADGSYRWSRVLGGANNDNVKGIATDPTTGNVLVTGGYAGSVDFGGGAVRSGSAGLATSMFLASYDPLGNFLWVKAWGGDLPGGTDTGMALKIDTSGQLALTGYFSSWMDFNLDGVEDAPGSGYFVASFTLSGNAQPVFQWAKRSLTGNGIGNAVTFDTTGHVLTAGSWSSSSLALGSLTISTPGTGAFVTCHSE